MKTLLLSMRFYKNKIKGIFFKDRKYKKVHELYDILDERFKPLLWINGKGELMYGSTVRCGVVMAICDMELSNENREIFSVDENFVLPVFGIILEENEAE